MHAIWVGNYSYFLGPSTTTSSSDGISILSSKCISSMTPLETFFVFWVSIIKQVVLNTYVLCFYLIIEWIIIFISHVINLIYKVILLFLFSCSIIYHIKFLFEVKELIVIFLCFYFHCFSILNLRFNVRMFNFFMLRGLNKSSTSSFSNWPDCSKKSISSLILRLLSLSSCFFSIQ